MNEEELRIKLGRLRTPAVNPAALERALERAARAMEEADLVGQGADAAISDRTPDDGTARERTPIVTAWTWRDWLWPSPLAWGAIAIAWAAILAADHLLQPPSTSRDATLASETDAQSPPQRPLYLTRNDYNAQLQELQQWTKNQ